MRLILLCALILIAGTLPALGQLEVTTVGDTIKICDKNTDWYCAAKFVIEMVRRDTLMHVVEHDTSSDHATCTCRYTLCASLVGLPAGNYTAQVFRRYYQYVWGQPLRDVSYLIGIVRFAVIAPSQLAESATLYQSDCQQDPGAVPAPTGHHEVTGLLNSYPNPFNNTATIRFRVASRSYVTLAVCDILGREITRLVDERKEPGEYAVQFSVGSTGSIASGTYFYRLYTRPLDSDGATVETRKLLLVR